MNIQAVADMHRYLFVMWGGAVPPFEVLKKRLLHYAEAYAKDMKQMIKKEIDEHSPADFSQLIAAN